MDPSGTASDTRPRAGAHHEFLEAEDIVAKLQHVEHWISAYPYRNETGSSYFDGIRRALQHIPQEFHSFAWALFANVIYLPPPMLDAAWQFLFAEIVRDYGVSADMLWDTAHIFELDPSGLQADFARANDIRGRLDSDRFPRFATFGALLGALDEIVRTKSRPDDPRVAPVRIAFSKRYWVLLTDYAFSGTSLRSEIEKVHELFEWLGPGGPVPKFIVCSQVMTSDALSHIMGGPDQEFANVDLHYALYFDHAFKVNDDGCELFERPGTLDGVRRLCEWFAGEILSRDNDKAPTIKLSGDDMRFGFKGGGWTIVPYTNALTNSIPLLWYAPKQLRLLDYVGPFPRVDSRETQAAGQDRKILQELKRSKTAAKALRGVLSWGA